MHQSTLTITGADYERFVAANLIPAGVTQAKTASGTHHVLTGPPAALTTLEAKCELWRSLAIDPADAHVVPVSPAWRSPQAAPVVPPHPQPKPAAGHG